MSSLRQNWPSFWITGFIAVCASWILTGCRLGNHVESVEQPKPYSYFALTPKRLFLCVLKRGETGDGTCAETTLDKVTEWTAYLTDPVIFYQPNTASREAYLVSKDFKRTLPMLLDTASGATFKHSSYTTPVAAFHHTDCVEQMVNYGQGTYKTQAGTPPAGDGTALAGRIELAMLTEHIISGNCTQTLQEMRDCYKDTSTDKTACGMAAAADNQAEHAWVQAFFAPYIDRGLMVPDDIADIAEVYYQFNYE